jgi:hypothetical protein
MEESIAVDSWQDALDERMTACLPDTGNMDGTGVPPHVYPLLCALVVPMITTR